MSRRSRRAIRPSLRSSGARVAISNPRALLKLSRRRTSTAMAMRICSRASGQVATAGHRVQYRGGARLGGGPPIRTRCGQTQGCGNAGAGGCLDVGGGGHKFGRRGAVWPGFRHGIMVRIRRETWDQLACRRTARATSRETLLRIIA
jgi:hypothetical protein